MRNRIFIAALVVLFLAYFSNSYSTQRKEASNGKLLLGIRISLADVRYLGENKYGITFLIDNQSAEMLQIRRPAIKIYAQVNTGRWWEEVITDYDGLFNSIEKFILKPFETKELSLTARIPQVKGSNLFTNSDGDLSLRVQFDIPSFGGSMDKKTEEIYLWLHPETDKWILREGM